MLVERNDDVDAECVVAVVLATLVEKSDDATSIEFGGCTAGICCVDGGINVVGVLVDVVLVLSVLVLVVAMSALALAAEPPTNSGCGWLNGKWPLLGERAMLSAGVVGIVIGIGVGVGVGVAVRSAAAAGGVWPLMLRLGLAISDGGQLRLGLLTLVGCVGGGSLV